MSVVVVESGTVVVVAASDVVEVEGSIVVVVEAPIVVVVEAPIVVVVASSPPGVVSWAIAANGSENSVMAASTRATRERAPWWGDTRRLIPPVLRSRAKSFFTRRRPLSSMKGSSSPKVAAV
jgi:hypothetical protein